MTEAGARALGWLTAALAGRAMPPLVIAIGLGDGALLDALDEVAPATRVLALEPDVTATCRPSSPESQRRQAAGNLVHLVAPDFAGAEDAWRLFPPDPDDHQLFIHPESAVRAKAHAVRAARIAQQAIFGARANAAARRQFAAPYLLNTLSNVPAMARGADVSVLKNAYAGTPAVVVGAGPSLDDVLPELAACASGALVIATDTALRPLLHAGVTPQIVAGLDPSQSNARHFLALPECGDSWLVAESALPSEAVETFAGRTLWFRAGDHHPWPCLTAHGLAVSELPVWGSVLTAAYQVAWLAGCDPIVFVGADLAFTAGRPYARGTTYEFDWAYSAALGSNVSTAWQMQIAMRDSVPELDLHGRTTQTSSPLRSFRDWLVAHAARSGRRVVNASGQGLLHGPGIEHSSLAAVVDARSPVRPLDTVAMPPACVRPDVLRRELAAVRNAGLDGRGTARQAWREFAGDRLDVAALDQVLDASVARLGGQTEAEVAAPSVHIPWKTLPAAWSDYAHVSRLPERMADAWARLNGGLGEPAIGDLLGGTNGAAVDALTTLLVSLLKDVAGQPTPLPRAPASGAPTVSGECEWPRAVAWPMALFESAAVMGRSDTGPPTFFNRAVRLSDEQPRVDSPRLLHDTAGAQARLVAQWLAVVLACPDATVSDAAAAAELRGVLDAAVRADVTPSAVVNLVLELDRDTGERETVTLDVPVDVRRLARAVTGTLAPAASGAGGVPVGRQVSAQVGAWRIACVLRAVNSTPGVTVTQPEPRRVELRALTDHGLVRSAFCYGTAHGAVCVGIHERGSMLVRPDGRVEPFTTWPKPIVGELPFGDGGAVAWQNGTAQWPEVGPGYLLYRDSPTAEVEEVELPFRPTTGAWWQGRLYFVCYPAGLGVWTPGVGAESLPIDQSFNGLVPDDDGVALASCICDEWGRYERGRRPEPDWRISAPGRVTPVRSGAPVAAAVARHPHGWVAEAHPLADRVALTHPSAPASTLTCYDALRVAWAGDSLLVCTSDGEVVLFPDLVAHLAGGPA